VLRILNIELTEVITIGTTSSNITMSVAVSFICGQTIVQFQWRYLARQLNSKNEISENSTMYIFFAVKGPDTPANTTLQNCRLLLACVHVLSGDVNKTFFRAQEQIFTNCQLILLQTMHSTKESNDVISLNE